MRWCSPMLNTFCTVPGSPPTLECLRCCSLKVSQKKQRHTMLETWTPKLFFWKPLAPIVIRMSQTGGEQCLSRTTLYLLLCAAKVHLGDMGRNHHNPKCHTAGNNWPLTQNCEPETGIFWVGEAAVGYTIWALVTFWFIFDDDFLGKMTQRSWEMAIIKWTMLGLFFTKNMLSVSREGEGFASPGRSAHQKACGKQGHH